MKFIGSLVGVLTSLGVGQIVGHAIKSTTPKKIGKITKFLVWIGSIGLTTYLSKRTAEHAECAVNETLERLENIKNGEEEA